MKQDWSNEWKASKQPRKQKKYRFNAPFHTRSNFLHVHLSKELKVKVGKRSVQVKKGDRIKILRGSNRGKTGVVDKTSIKNTKVYITGIELTKVDGSKKLIAFDPSNLMITELNLKDKKREVKLTQKIKSPKSEEVKNG